MKTSNLTALLIAAALIVGAIIYLDNNKAARGVPAAAVEVPPVAEPPTLATEEKSMESAPASSVALLKKTTLYERAKEITTPDDFINTDGKPLTISELIGKKVVLVDFWTYSCINCQRTIPYLNSWWQKYKDKGLVIIGLHTPEFEFEKVYENVRAAVKKFGIEYPVVLDNDYSTWQAYRNRYWPRKYLIDIDGYIVYDHVGEGGYEETERQIQKALEERMTRLGEAGNVDIAVTRETSLTRPESPETYFGASRNENLGNGERSTVGVQKLSVPEDLARNTLYLGGEWNIQREHAENVSAPAVIEFRYKAKDVYFVASSMEGVTARLYLDGKLLKGEGATVIDCKLNGWCGGEDVSIDGTVTIKEDRLYKLIEHKDSEEHVLKIEIEKPGLKAFTFTFG